MGHIWVMFKREPLEREPIELYLISSISQGSHTKNVNIYILYLKIIFEHTEH